MVRQLFEESGEPVAHIPETLPVSALYAMLPRCLPPSGSFTVGEFHLWLAVAAFLSMCIHLVLVFS